MPSSSHPADLDLLALEFKGLAGPLAPPRGIRFVSTGAADRIVFGSGVPSELVEALETVGNGVRRWRDPTRSPPALAQCVKVLATSGWMVRHGTTQLVYAIHPGVRHEADAPIQRSDGRVPAWLRRANPGDWHPVEWNELLDGQLGPWAMVTRHRRVVSICHTPVPMTDDFAEAGVWTALEFRARGYAAAVTAAWADILAQSGRHLFYSTDVDNRSSQRVAERLKLRRLGHARSLTDAKAERPFDRHPLSQRPRE
jgi:RimJ/RimL family protein N-acetyltransferase